MDKKSLVNSDHNHRYSLPTRIGRDIGSFMERLENNKPETARNLKRLGAAALAVGIGAGVFGMAESLRNQENQERNEIEGQILDCAFRGENVCSLKNGQTIIIRQVDGEYSIDEGAIVRDQPSRPEFLGPDTSSNATNILDGKHASIVNGLVVEDFSNTHNSLLIGGKYENDNWIWTTYTEDMPFKEDLSANDAEITES